MRLFKSILQIRFCTATLLSLCFVLLHAGFSLSADITIAWDANSEDNLAGYKIYYLTASPNGWLSGTGLAQGESPITVHLGELKTSTTPSFQLSGLAPGESYHFSVTAYNKTGNESDFSNLVRHDAPIPAAYSLIGPTSDQGDVSPTGTVNEPMPVTYSLTTSTSGQGDISPIGPVSVSEGSSKTFIIAADANHHITDVIIDGKAMGSISSYTFDNTRAPHAIQAIFARDTYSVTASATGNGALTPENSLGVADVKVDRYSMGAMPEDLFPKIAENHLFDASFEENINEFSMEVGEVNVNNNWQLITYSRPFVNPVVVASALSNNDEEPAVVRINNITGTGFEICVQEWDYLDDEHLDETIGYVVMEAGRFTLPDGTAVEAGTYETGSSASLERIAFTGNFTQVPVVASSVASYNDPNAITIRLKDISSTQFEYQIREQQANRQKHLPETVSYIAWEPCRTQLGGLSIEVAKTDDRMTHDFKTITFNKISTVLPVFLATIQTTDGTDTAALRWEKRSTSNIQVKLEEEQSFDLETRHTSEVVGFFIFTPDTTASAD